MSALHHEAYPAFPHETEDPHQFRRKLLHVVADIEYVADVEPRVVYTASEGRILDPQTHDLLSAMQAATRKEQKARMDQLLSGN